MNINNVMNNGYISNTAVVNPYKDSVSIHNIKSGSRLSEKKTDTVSISSNADSFRAMNEKTKSISEEVKNSASAERVMEIKSKIENGTYAVSSGAAADAKIGRAHV